MTAVNDTLSPAAEALDAAGDVTGGGSLSRTLDAATLRAGDLTAEGLPSAEAVAQLQADLEDLDELRRLTPTVLVSPFQGDAESVVAPVTLAAYYAPAVVALLLQHMIVTFIALSVVRDDELGTVELFRVAPLSPLESVLGRSLAYLLLGAGIAAALVGLLVALVSRSDTQAIQASMTVMLASILLSGFLLSLDRFLPWLQRVAWFLPVRHGVELLRSIMLHGRVPSPEPLLALGGLALGLLGISWVLLQRRARRG